MQRTAKVILKNNVKRFTLINIKTYYNKAVLIKTVHYWHKDRETNRTE